MGASPKNAVEKKRVQKWMCQIRYKQNGHTSGGTVYVDAPTESEIVKALYARDTMSSSKYELVEITNKARIWVDE